MLHRTLPLAACASSATALPRRCTARHLIVDFDGTCTEADTTGLVAKLAARRGAPDVLSRFDVLERKFLQLLQECRSALPATGDRAALECALDAMDKVSIDITEELSESGILAGLQPSDAAKAIAEWRAANEADGAPNALALRRGCLSTLRMAADRGWSLGVLSLNWWPPLIHAFLPILSERDAAVWSNNIDAAGRVSSYVSGAAAKRDRIREIARDAASAADEDETPLVIYVGDSATDLLAMCESDVGILIGESGSARDIAERFGLRLEPLSVACASGRATLLAGRASDIIFEAAGWDDIDNAIATL